MSDHRNIRMPVSQPPGNFRMQQFPQQYVQPGMGMYPMMQSGGHMIQPPGQMPRQPNMMFPGQVQMGMRGPGIAPPPYRPTGMGQQYRANNQQFRQPMSPETMKKMEKEKFYHEQKQKLKQFHTQSVDPNKLIESMFGKTEKPKVKQKLDMPAADEDFNDSFGDFIGGPPVTTSSRQEPAVQTVESTSEVNGNQSPRGSNQNPKEEKKVDLNAMMLECSDLTAPNKAKTFQHKRSLKDLHPSHHTAHAVIHQESNQARQWKQMNLDDLGDMFVVEESIIHSRETTPEQNDFGLPHWCKDDSKIPELYKHVLEASLVEGSIQTERLYPILILSGLPKEVLGRIWSMCNKVTPGQLIKEELYLVLGFIFLAQNNQPLKIELLHRIPHAPVPFLAPPQHPPQINQLNTVPPVNQPIINQSFHSNHQTAGPPSVPPVSSVVNNAGSLGYPNVNMTTGTISQGHITPIHSMQGILPVPGPGVDSWHSHNIGVPVKHVQTSQTIGIPVKPVQTSLVNQTEDDEFADFQAAPKIEKDLAKDKTAKPVTSKEDKKEYLYSVPLPEDDIQDLQISTEQHYSNVSNFFGSDDSSGASTPNSLDEDFDDFKSAGRPSDSSQFTSSEQSENEDFKVLESYLDDFSKKKQQNEKQESPLHRPISKTTNLPPTAYSKNVTSIPAIKSLWSNKEGKKPTTVITPKIATDVSKTATFSPQSSDSEFADFQQAPVPKGNSLTSSASAPVLIGEEDKYAALRSFESIDSSGPSLFGMDKNTQENAEINDGEWADFQTTDTVSKDETPSGSLFSSATTVISSSNVSGFSDVTVEKQEVDLFGAAEQNEKISDDWFDFSKVASGEKNEGDEWADFQGPAESSHINRKILTSSVDDSPAPIISVSQSDLVSIKKKNLQHNEILGLFKPRSDPGILASYVLPDLSQNEADSVKESKKPAGYLETSLDEPKPFQQSFPTPKMDQKDISKFSVDDNEHFFHAPPPMDDVLDDDYEYGEFSQGYDIDEVSPKQPQSQENKKVYSMYGMEFTASTKPRQAVIDKKTDSALSSQFTFVTDGTQGDTQLGRVLKQEDSNSVSSLELPFPKVLQHVKDIDTISISSNEYAPDFIPGKTTADSKSLDSLDLKISESKSVDSLELKGGDGMEMEEKTENEEQKEEIDSDKNSEEYSTTTLDWTSSGPQQVRLFGDRYSGIMEDITGSDKYAYEWQRCLENCCRMIKEANNVFNSISSSSVCNEVIRSEQGTEYVQGIVEIYRIVCRITLSMNTSALSTDKLSQTLKDVNLVWNNLAAFLVGGNIMPDDNTLSFKHCVLKSDDAASQMRACGVCLLDVDVRGKDFNTDEDSAKLTYGGRQYHATCANFWVNCVDSMLPALRLPELL